ncbi:MAG: carbon-nitrogen hydrolase family protein [Alphaproteobacteria bacterium]|nr:carbon-nitrogen hydrolase family protein [Alphaproteobacteria bacterium]
MSDSFIAACVQNTAGREIEPNLELTCALIREAHGRGAAFVCLPENVTAIELDDARKVARALDEKDHIAMPVYGALAAELGIWLLIGSLTCRAGADKVANRSILLDASGDVVARYDKLHLFDVDLRGGEAYRESDSVAPGDRAVLAPTPWGLLGMTVCYDLRFPQLYRTLAQAGASFLSVPSAFTRTTGRAHWHTLLQARAIETGCFVFAPAQTGTHEAGRKTYGHSLIVDPWGEILADGGEDVGVVTATIDPARVAECRRMVPSLSHDRPFAAPELPAVAGQKRG